MFGLPPASQFSLSGIRRDLHASTDEYVVAAVCPSSTEAQAPLLDPHWQARLHKNSMACTHSFAMTSKDFGSSLPPQAWTEMAGSRTTAAAARSFDVRSTPRSVSDRRGSVLGRRFRFLALGLVGRVAAI